MHRFRRKGAASDLKKRQQDLDFGFDGNGMPKNTYPNIFPNNFHQQHIEQLGGSLDPVLPSDNDFRQSLILPHLSKRFSVLREDQRGPSRTPVGVARSTDLLPEEQTFAVTAPNVQPGSHLRYQPNKSSALARDASSTITSNSTSSEYRSSGRNYI